MNLDPVPTQTTSKVRLTGESRVPAFSITVKVPPQLEGNKEGYKKYVNFINDQWRKLAVLLNTTKNSAGNKSGAFVLIALLMQHVNKDQLRNSLNGIRTEGDDKLNKAVLDSDEFIVIPLPKRRK